MALPEFQDCPSCGDAPIQPYPETCLDCETNEGKFYDLITHDYTLQQHQTEGKIYVCDVTLWSACMWLAVCGGGKIAALKVNGINTQDNSLLVYNGCQGSNIAGNPAPGTSFAKGSVIYPIFPRCDDPTQTLCTQVAACLTNAEAICLTNILEVDEDIENHHLFAGTYGEGQDPDGDPEFWASCMRKLQKVYAGMYGQTFCFLNIPTTTDTPTTVGDTIYQKYLLYYDSFNKCMKRGPSVGDSTLCNAAPLEEEDDEYKFDTLVVCKGNVKKKIEPLCGYVMIGKHDEDGDPYWVYEKLNTQEILATAVELKSFANVANGTYNYQYDLVEDYDVEIPCWANYAIIECRVSALGVSSATKSVQVKRPSTNTFIDYVAAGSTAAASNYTEKTLPLTDGKVDIKVIVSGSGTGTVGFQLIGFTR